MIQLDQRFVDAVREATTPDDLRASVQKAIELEFATLPPYLTARMSLRRNTNDEIRGVLSAVIRDEMLHMLLDCNMLVALGGTPSIDSPLFVPVYPGPLPMGVISGLIVGAEPFSIDLVRRIFMEIEQPEDPLQLRDMTEAPLFATIGDFYAALADKLKELGDSAFSGDPTGQLIGEEFGFGEDRLFPIVDVASAVKAIDVIVQEGEGTHTSPLDDAGQVAHYYRFEQIVRGKTLVADPNAPQGFSYTGSPVPFDAAGVFPITANQRLADLDPASQAGQQARKFSRTLTDMLIALHKAFSGDPSEFGPARVAMFRLASEGNKLCATEVLVDGQPTGRNAGPTWEYLTAEV